MKKVTKEVKSQECKILASPSGELVHAVHVFHGEIEKRLDSILTKKEGLTLSQYLVLVGLSSKEASMSQAKLAEKLRLTEATVSRHISILVKRKLLERKKEANNKKSYTISLTSLGIEVFQKTEEQLLEAVDSYLSILTTKEKSGVTTELKKVISVLQSTT